MPREARPRLDPGHAGAVDTGSGSAILAFFLLRLVAVLMLRALSIAGRALSGFAAGRARALAGA